MFGCELAQGANGHEVSQAVDPDRWGWARAKAGAVICLILKGIKQWQGDSYGVKRQKALPTPQDSPSNRSRRMEFWIPKKAPTLILKASHAIE
jgi:hypothetical protein